MQGATQADSRSETALAETVADADVMVPSHLPIEEKADGSIVIDLKPLASKPTEDECIASDPNPLDNAIIVCGTTVSDQRLTSDFGPIDEAAEFGSAIPRTRLKLSEDAEANLFNKGVGVSTPMAEKCGSRSTFDPPLFALDRPRYCAPGLFDLVCSHTH